MFINMPKASSGNASIKELGVSVAAGTDLQNNTELDLWAQLFKTYSFPQRG